MAALTPFYYAPAGERWPWRPVFRGSCVLVERGIASGELQVDLEVSEIKIGRVGLRRWVRSRWEMLTHVL